MAGLHPDLRPDRRAYSYGLYSYGLQVYGQTFGPTDAYIVMAYIVMAKAGLRPDLRPDRREHRQWLQCLQSLAVRRGRPRRAVRLAVKHLRSQRLVADYSYGLYGHGLLARSGQRQ